MVQNGQSWGLLQQAKVPPANGLPHRPPPICGRDAESWGAPFTHHPNSPTSVKPSATRICVGRTLSWQFFLWANGLEASAPLACFCTGRHCCTSRALFLGDVSFNPLSLSIFWAYKVILPKQPRLFREPLSTIKEAPKPCPSHYPSGVQGLGDGRVQDPSPCGPSDLMTPQKV